MEQLYELFRSLLQETNTSFVRYLHSEIDWNARMIAIVGARGVGKTTMLLQHIKIHNSTDDTLFISADDLYFTEHKLFDTASTFYKNNGKHLYIDEIHKYSDWSRELKMIYDHFPKLQVIFTGSSILDIYKGSADLSRRVLMYHLAGLSFREYLNISQKMDLPAYSLEEIIKNKVELPDIEHPLPLFREYLQKGYYPFFAEGGYEQRLRQILTLTLESDIPFYASMTVTTSKKLKQLLYIISKSVPFKPNFTKIATMMEVHRNQVTDFMFYLEKAGIISQLRTQVQGIRALGKVEKVYLGNTNLIHALAEDKPEIGNLRETFFFSQMSVKNDVFSSDISDFTINSKTFEIGGKKKGQKQIEEATEGYVVKDDIEFGYMNSVPLWAFGFNY
ncbi:MAG: AAA family ATPase [Bacteroidales bacterium]